MPAFKYSVRYLLRSSALTVASCVSISFASAASQLLISGQTLTLQRFNNRSALPDGVLLDADILVQGARTIAWRSSDVLVFDLDTARARNLADMPASERSAWLCVHPGLAAYDPNLAFGFQPLEPATSIVTWLQENGRVVWLPDKPTTGSCGYHVSALRATPAGIDFSQVPPGTTQTQSVVLSNGGDADVSLGALQSPFAPFGINTDQCSGTTLPVGGDCSFNVTFSSTAIGRQLDLIGIPSNDPAQLQTALLVAGGQSQTIFRDGFE